MATNFNFTESGYVPTYNSDFTPGYYSYNILAGINNNFTAIWADPDTGLSTGKIYVASPAAFSVVNGTVLVDYYTTSFGGRANEPLEQNDIKDINV